MQLNQHVGRILSEYPAWTTEYVSDLNCNMITYEGFNFVVVATQPDSDMSQVLNVALLFNIESEESQPLELLNKFNNDYEDVKVCMETGENGTTLAFSTFIYMEFIDETTLNNFVHSSAIQILGAFTKGCEAGLLPSIPE